MKKLPEGLDDYHRHEALDRASMLADMVDEHLRQHAFIQSQPKLLAKVERAVKLLSEVYQKIGEEHL